MFRLIGELLRADDYFGMSEVIEKAKGQHKLPMTLKQGVKQAKRKAKWR